VEQPYWSTGCGGAYGGSEAAAWDRPHLPRFSHSRAFMFRDSAIAIHVHIPRTRFFVSPCIFSLCFLLILRWLSVSVDRHIRCNGGCCPYRRACRGVMFCVALKASVGCTCVRLYRCGVKTLSSMGCAMDSEPAGVEATDPVRRGLRG
jgi:hypothetical protein